MLGHELAVEQPETARNQSCDQPGERHLGRVGAGGKHALAKEGAAQLHAVQPADQFLAFPAFDRMGMAEADADC
jgi:hypothetical protein